MTSPLGEVIFLHQSLEPGHVCPADSSGQEQSATQNGQIGSGPGDALGQKGSGEDTDDHG